MSAFCIPSYPTKKAFKEAVTKGERIRVFECCPWGDDRVLNGKAVLEMPKDYHRWYAGVVVKDGQIVKVS